MKDRFRVVVFLCGVILASLALFPAIFAQEIRIESNSVEYALPFPGILPDHPFYFLKSTRDTLVALLTRDYMKKAKLYLINADKKIHMAQLLSKKGKWQLTAKMAQEAQTTFSESIPALKTSKDQGVSPPSEFINTLKLSNVKHHQVLENLLKDAPFGVRENLEKALSTNINIKEKLLKL